MSVELEKDIKELEGLVNQAERQTVKNILTSELDRLRTTYNTHKMLEEQQVPTPVINPTREHNQPELVFDPIEKYAWDQGNKFVKIYVSLDKVKDLVKRENITCSFESKGFNLAIIGFEKKNLRLSFSNLSGEIKPEESNILVKSDMIIVRLVTVGSNKWSDLLVKKVEKSEDTPKQQGPPGGPGGEANPQAGMMDMMQKMYNEGDDNMKRTINEAWSKAQSGKGGPPGEEGGMPGMPGMGGMGGMPGMPGMGGMGGMPGMGGMGGMPGMGGMGGMPGMGGMGGAGGMEGLQQMMAGMGGGGGGGMGGAGGMEGLKEMMAQMGGGMGGMGMPDLDDGGDAPDMDGEDAEEQA